MNNDEIVSAYYPFSWMVIGTMSCLQFADCILSYFSDAEAKESAEIVAASKYVFVERDYDVVVV